MKVLVFFRNTSAFFSKFFPSYYYYYKGITKKERIR